MRRALPVGLAALAAVLAPMLAWAQTQQAPVVATPLPLLPPTVQYPQASPAPDQTPAQGAPPQYQQPLNQPPQYQTSQYQQQYPPQQYPPQQYQPQQYPAQQYQPQYRPPPPQYQPQPGQPPQFQQTPQYPQPSAQQPQGQTPPAQPSPAQHQPAQQQPGQQPQGQPPRAAPPPGQTPTAATPAPGQPAAQDQGQPPPTPEQPAPPPPNPWLPQGSAVLQGLDKVNAQTTTLTVKVGQTATYGSLSITVQACVVRPPDMPQDAAAFLTIVDNHPDQPGFKGWMLKSDPSLSMLEHPLYDVRVIGCAP